MKAHQKIQLAAWIAMLVFFIYCIVCLFVPIMVVRSPQERGGLSYTLRASAFDLYTGQHERPKQYDFIYYGFNTNQNMESFFVSENIMNAATSGKDKNPIQGFADGFFFSEDRPSWTGAAIIVMAVSVIIFFEHKATKKEMKEKPGEITEADRYYYKTLALPLNFLLLSGGLALYPMACVLLMGLTHRDNYLYHMDISVCLPMLIVLVMLFTGVSILHSRCQKIFLASFLASGENFRKEETLVALIKGFFSGTKNSDASQG